MLFFVIHPSSSNEKRDETRRERRWRWGWRARIRRGQYSRRLLLIHSFVTGAYLVRGRGEFSSSPFRPRGRARVSLCGDISSPSPAARELSSRLFIRGDYRNIALHIRDSPSPANILEKFIISRPNTRKFEFRVTPRVCIRENLSRRTNRCGTLSNLILSLSGIYRKIERKAFPPLLSTHDFLRDRYPSFQSRR